MAASEIKNFDVAFSFAGEQRHLIEPIARELGDRKYEVFFYPDYQAELAKPNLDLLLRRIYGHGSRLIVPVLSSDYQRKPWTGTVELTVVREIIFAGQDEKIMALRADDATVEGFSDLHGYIDTRSHSAVEIADLIEQRLRPAGAPLATPPVRDRVTFLQNGGMQPANWAPPATRDGAFSQLWSIANARFRTDVLERPITPERLERTTCLVLPIGPAGSTQFRDQELDAIKAFVRCGQGLLLLGTYFGDRHHLANLNALAETFGIEFNGDVLMPPNGRPNFAGRADIRLDLVPAGSRRRGGVARAQRDTPGRLLQDQIVAGIKRIRSRDCCSLTLRDDTVGLLWSIPPNCRFEVPYSGTTPMVDHDRWPPPAEETACVAAASTRAKVVVCGGWRTFSTTLLQEKGSDNQVFFENVLGWLAAAPPPMRD